MDQRESRAGPDRVPALLDLLAPVPSHGRFERTAGDEVQGLLTDPGAVARALEKVLRTREWYVGLGIGGVGTPLPRMTRAGRGPAFLHARDAVTAAKSGPWRIRVVGDDVYRCRQLESGLWLWTALLDRRTARGWEVVDLVDEGLTYQETGQRLGITQSAVSQRAATAGLVEGLRARELVTHLVSAALGQPADGER